MSNIESPSRSENETKLPIIGINSVDRRIYVNGVLKLHLFPESNNNSWNIFNTLAKNPQSLVKKGDFLPFSPSELFLQNTIDTLNASLSTHIGEDQMIKEVTDTKRLIGFVLYARVAVVKF